LAATVGGSPTTAAGPARHGAPRVVVAEDREFADARVGIAPAEFEQRRQATQRPRREFGVEQAAVGVERDLEGAAPCRCACTVIDSRALHGRAAAANAPFASRMAGSVGS
jgi:hypothetical protein